MGGFRVNMNEELLKFLGKWGGGVVGASGRRGKGGSRERGRGQGGCE